MHNISDPVGFFEVFWDYAFSGLIFTLLGVCFLILLPILIPAAIIGWVVRKTPIAKLLNGND